MQTFTTITDVRAYVESVIGEWPDGTVGVVAGEIRDLAHQAGLRYCQDWSAIVDQVLPEQGWEARIEALLVREGAGDINRGIWR